MNTTPEQYRLPPAPLAAGARDCYRVLSLSGGGYRGLFTARLLAHIEAMNGHGDEPIGSRFDMIAGTSVGGLIAVALACGLTAGRIGDLLAGAGPAIFPRLRFKGLRKLVSRRVYDARPLERVIRDGIGAAADTALADLAKPLLLTTVSWTRGELRLLRSGGLGSDPVFERWTLLQATRATSAAPAHFPAAGIGGDWYVDGGLAANCPDLHALIAARAQGLPVRLLGIGTAGVARASLPGKVPLRGVAWARPALDLAMEAQERLAQQACARELGFSYLYLNRRPGVGQEKLKDLDCADRDTSAALTALADARFEALMSDPAQLQQLDWIVAPVPL